jgi:hypothetical protein
LISKVLSKFPFSPIELLTLYEITNFCENSTINIISLVGPGVFPNPFQVGCPTETAFCLHLHHFLNPRRVWWGMCIIGRYLGEWNLKVLQRWKREHTKKEIGPHSLNHQLSSYKSARMM